jgi:hypothetical protein
LRQAVEKADQAAVEALEPRKRGRKPRKLKEQEASELMREKSSLEKELDHWKQKYEVAKTFIELERKLERQEQLPGRKKTRNQQKKERQRDRGGKKGKS